MATKKKKVPALRTRVSRVKKKLLSNDLVEEGAADLAAHDPEVADALLDGVTLEEDKPQHGFVFHKLVANKAFTGTYSQRSSMARGLRAAVLAAPDGSEAAALRETITGFGMSGAVDMAVLLEAMPALEALDVWNPQFSNLDAIRGSGLRYLGTTNTGVLDLSPLRDAPLTHLSLGNPKELSGFDALQTMPLKVLHLKADDVDADWLADLELEELTVFGPMRNPEKLPRTLRTLVWNSKGTPVDPSFLEHLDSLEDLVLLAPVTSLPPMPKLVQLKVRNARITDISWMSGMPGVTDLRLTGNELLTDISDLPERIELLEIKECPKLTDVSVLDGRSFFKLDVGRCGCPDRPGKAPYGDAWTMITWPTPYGRQSGIRSMKRVDTPQATAALVECLADRSEDVVRAAAEALLERPDASDALGAAIRTGSPGARRAAAWAMFGQKRPEALEPLIEGLDAIGPVAAVALSRIPGREAARAVLEAACGSGDPELRRWSAFTLGAIGDAASETTLAGLLDDDAFKVRRAALGSLFRIGAVDALRRGTTDPHPQLQRLAHAWLAPRTSPLEREPSRSPPRPKAVELRTTKLPDFSKVDFDTVEYLDIGAGKHSQVDDTFVLPTMPSLTHLAILSRKLTSARIAARHRKLQFLWLSYNKKLRSLDGVEQLTVLRDLIVRNTSVKDLTPLAGLDLAWFIGHHTRISDLTPLYGNTRLERLDVAATKVSDLAGIEALQHLRYLNISETRVTDLSPLAELPRLETLGIRKMNVDFSGLVRLPKVQALVFGPSSFDHSEWVLFEPRIQVDLHYTYGRTDPIGYRAIQQAVEADDPG